MKYTQEHLDKITEVRSLLIDLAGDVVLSHQTVNSYLVQLDAKWDEIYNYLNN